MRRNKHVLWWNEFCYELLILLHSLQYPVTLTDLCMFWIDKNLWYYTTWTVLFCLVTCTYKVLIVSSDIWLRRLIFLLLLTMSWCCIATWNNLPYSVVLHFMFCIISVGYITCSFMYPLVNIDRFQRRKQSIYSVTFCVLPNVLL